MTEPTAFSTWPAIRPLPSDGIAGLYADRVLDRGADPRVLVSLSRTHRLEEERLPVMASAFEEGCTVYERPSIRTSRVPGSRRLLAAAAIAAVLLPLGAMVAGAEGAEDVASTYAEDLGYYGEVDLPAIGIGAIVNPASLGLGMPGGGSASGSVTVNGRERRNQVDAEVYTSEESTIVIDGERVDSAERAPMHLPGVVPGVPALPGF